LHAVVVISHAPGVLCANIISCVTHIASRAVRVLSTATEVISTTGPTHRSKLRTVVISGTSRETGVIITIFTGSVWPGGVTHFLGTITVNRTLRATSHTPVTVITDVALRAVRVFLALR